MNQKGQARWHRRRTTGEIPQAIAPAAEADARCHKSHPAIPIKLPDCANCTSVSSGQFADRPGGNVVQDDGQIGRAGDGLKMPDHAALHRLVVIRDDREDGVGAGGHCAPRQLDGLAGRIGIPAPAMTRTRPRAVSTAARTMVCNARRVSASRPRPWFPPTTTAETPAAIWHSHSFANAFRSISPSSSKGVGRSGM